MNILLNWIRLPSLQSSINARYRDTSWRRNVSFDFILPNQNNEPDVIQTEANSVIIVGANGSGKTRLGAWIEKKCEDAVHRIGAQRSLSVDRYIQAKSFEESIDLLLHGSGHQRWPWDIVRNQHNYETAMIDDFSYALSALVAKRDQEEHGFFESCREKEQQNLHHDPTPQTIIDTLQKIWSSVFPHRNLRIEDKQVIAEIPYAGFYYNGCEMSDGERVALYLISQALCVPSSKTIIIDEPELHLHRSIMNRLWRAIEEERQDCLFIYITHDTHFAANHQLSKKIWVKCFDGINWEWEIIQDSTLPDQLLLDILGNRKKVLFTEGEAGSIDAAIYSSIYVDCYVVPCGSCNKVIERTRAMKHCPQLHHLECYGLIDRDYRSENEIENLKKQGVFTLGVAEVENLFATEEVLREFNSVLELGNETIASIKDYVIDTCFANRIGKQISSAFICEFKHRVAIINVDNGDVETAKNALLQESEKLTEIHQEVTEKFTSALAERDYREILRLFNDKSISKDIGPYFGMKKGSAYPDSVLRLLRGGTRQVFIKALLNYLPEEIGV